MTLSNETRAEIELALVDIDNAIAEYPYNPSLSDTKLARDRLRRLLQQEDAPAKSLVERIADGSHHESLLKAIAAWRKNYPNMDEDAAVHFFLVGFTAQPQ